MWWEATLTTPLWTSQAYPSAQEANLRFVQHFYRNL